MTDLAETLQKEGHYTEAEKLQREILDHVRTIFGTDSPQTLEALQELAICLNVQKRYDEGKPLRRSGASGDSHQTPGRPCRRLV